MKSAATYQKLLKNGIPDFPILEFWSIFEMLHGHKQKILRLDSGLKYSEGDVEYTILEWACLLLKSEEEIENFRAKITVLSGDEVYRSGDIHSILDKISIEGVTLPLSRILPRSCKFIDRLNVILENFKPIGERIHKIIGIQKQAEPEHYYSLLIDELKICNDNRTRIIDNTEQLIFVLLYQRKTGTHDPFCVYTRKGEKYLYNLDSMAYSLVGRDFVNLHNIIDFERYHDLDRYKDLLFAYDYNELTFLNGPLDRSGTLRCEMIPEDISDEYIRSEEGLPEYICQWIATDPSRTTLLIALGILSSESSLIQLRAALLHDLSFNAQDEDSLSSLWLM